jgi:DNA-directed RNA polymerase subunit M/transcription elongation factor TFIIS
MTIEELLMEDASAIAEQIRQTKTELNRRISELEVQLGSLRASLLLATEAEARSENFAPTLEGNYPCPQCWVRDGNSSSLKPTSGANPDTDYFACSKCGYDLEIGP